MLSSFPFSSELALAAALGPPSHLLLFIRGEWHMQAPLLFALLPLSWAALTIASNILYSTPLLSAAAVSTLLLTVYLATLFTSMTIYRVLFHPLRKYPGPFLASVTQVWHVWQCRGAKGHLAMDNLHKQYGNFVRTGPTELTVFDPVILPFMLAEEEAHFRKGVPYDIGMPYEGLSGTRNKAHRERRRRVWNPGFTSKALSQYEPRIKKHVDELDIRFGKDAGSVVDAWQVFSWFGFDVMGDLAFGRSFDMLRNEEWLEAIAILKEGMVFVGPLALLPWLPRIALAVPLKSTKDWRKMIAWVLECLTERMQRDSNELDMMQPLLDASKEKGTLSEDVPMLHGDTLTMVIAGSDTVSLTLTYIFYRLARHPKHQHILEEELNQLDSVSDVAALGTLQHLNAVIHETMRLHPALLTGGVREATEAVNISGHYIPAGTVIQAPRYTLGRLESCFEKATGFIPERWYSKPEMVKDRRAYAPFSLGRTSCIGKSVAWMELRLAVARLVSRFSVSFAPGYDAESFERNTLDHFTSNPGRLPLVFKQRS